jgi:hypothetical protein
MISPPQCVGRRWGTPIWRNTTLRVHWIMQQLFPEIQRSGREEDHPHLSVALVKNKWSYTSTSESPLTLGPRWSSWLRHCTTNRKVAGSIPDGVSGLFHWRNPVGRTMALGSTQSLTEMSTRDISWGVKAAGAYGWQPYNHQVPTV